MSTHFSIIHLISHIGPRSFGLGPVALNLALEQLRLGHDTEIWCMDTPEDQRWASESNGFPIVLRVTNKKLYTPITTSPMLKPFLLDVPGPDKRGVDLDIYEGVQL